MSDWLDNVSEVNNKATYRALNKASSKTNTQFKRQIMKDTGLKSSDVAKRLYQKKANSKSLSAFVSLGTKFGISLSLFKPKVKIVKKGRGKTARKYNGVTVNIPVEGGRFLVPNGFLMTAKSGKSLVVVRSSASRLPLKEQKYSIDSSGRAHQSSLVTYMREEFKKQFSDQLKLLVK